MINTLCAGAPTYTQASLSGASWPGRDCVRSRTKRGRNATPEGPTFEFRLRTFDVWERETEPSAYLGIAEGFPYTPCTHPTVAQAELDLMNALGEHLGQKMDYEATQVEWRDFPPVRAVALRFDRSLADEGRRSSS
jgi:hypothetical protein